MDGNPARRARRGEFLPIVKQVHGLSTMKKFSWHVRVAALVAAVAIATAPGRMAAQEKSVKPGINDHYAKDGLDKHLKVLENENRAAIRQCDRLLAACALKPGMVVADVGAGTGYFTRRIAPKLLPGGKVYAVDITRAFLDHIEKTCREQKIDNVTSVLCTTTSTELPADALDLAFVCDTYHHFEFPQKTLASLRQALRTGGKLVVVEFHKAGTMAGHVRAGKKTTIDEIAAGGFRLVGEEDNLGDQYVLRFEKDSVPTTLQYEIFAEDSAVPINAVLEALERRLNPRRSAPSAKITQVGPRRIQIELRDNSATNVQRIDSLITQLDGLEFQILAHPQVNKREIALASQLGKNESQVRDGTTVVARWIPVADGAASRFQMSTIVARETAGGEGEVRREVLVLHDPNTPRGAQITRCRLTVDERANRAVEIQFDAEGARRMKALTSSHLPDKSRDLSYQLGILWNGKLMSAPTLHATIEKSAIITGSFTKQEVDDMVRILNAGAAPARLTRVSGPLPRSQ
jgi:ubiquinone/menaquinone biosynthesis C-methylase UbiE